MRNLTPAAAALFVALLAGGCLSHLPPVAHKHMQVNWAPSYEEAEARAQRENKPILACLVAGAVDGLC